MARVPSKTLHYKRSNFATQLPVAFRYTLSHAWLAEVSAGRWRVGLTKFATRMLGEMVDHGFDTEPATPVQCGQILGWVEGFKAISDLYCVGEGRFLGSNPDLKKKIQLITKDPYAGGWLYEFEGRPDPRSLIVEPYRDHLDRTIELLLAKQKL